MKKIYSVPVRYIFEGTFKVEAENSEEAKEKILKHCGMVMGSGIQTTLPDHEIDWVLCSHPCKQVGRISREERAWLGYICQGMTSLQNRAAVTVRCLFGRKMSS